MRILSGKYKGRTIKMPKGIRPTQDKVRKALFDILKDCIIDVKFLDLFAGSGVVGIEALSHGAKEAAFVEKDRQFCKIIEQNLSYVSQLASWTVGRFNRQTSKSLPSACRLPARRPGTGRDGQGRAGVNRQTILNMDVFRAIKNLAKDKHRFDIVFLDPPYYRDMAKNTLQMLTDCDILLSASLVVVQHYKKDQLPDELGKLVLWRKARYGDTILSFYRTAN